MRFPLATLLSVTLFFLLASSCKKDGDRLVSYNAHIRPIFSDKCFKCHGPDANQRKADFRLDTKAGTFASLKDHPNKKAIVPGHPEQSEVYLRIMSDVHDYMMPTPESGLSLSAQEKDLIKKWIEQGAVYEDHWAFQSIKKPALPENKNDWTRNEIDLFVADYLDQNGLEPQKDEAPEKLLKRLYHDITGLPPSVADQDKYGQKLEEEVYAQLVDKLLADPAYGEKMAIFWMDISRYADSHGYQDDGLRTMWPWRDWVIHAFNRNYGYDQFLTWQLAGDLMPNATKEMILATGFNRNHKITQEGGVIDEEYRVEYVSDRTNTLGKGILGITLECAKCHDHKYDPFTQKDYFSTYAFFNKVNEKGFVGDISLASLADPPLITITPEEKKSTLPFISKRDTGEVKVMVMNDSSATRKTFILKRGVYDQPGEAVTPRPPVSILAFDTSTYRQDRLGLAQWITNRKNPLTSRVFVNFIWQEFFGRGLVKTSGDFGLQGELPSHPELLDWLAADFMEHGWNIKRLIKQIVTSSTYRQSSSVTKESLAKDPDNKWLSRGPRQKLSSELLNDHVLATSGLLERSIGGPSVKPYQPKGLWESATSGRGQLAIYKQDKGADLYRRGLYHFIKRTTPPPQMLIFDASNRDQCEVKRNATNTPLQSLVLLNDTRVMEASRCFAEKLLTEKQTIPQLIHHAFRTIVCRKPKSAESQSLQAFFDKTRANMTPEKAKPLLAIGEKASIKNINQADAAALMQTIQLIYNLEETSMR